MIYRTAKAGENVFSEYHDRPAAQHALVRSAADLIASGCERVA